MTESRERNAAQDVPISEIDSIQLRPARESPSQTSALGLYAWALSPSLLPPDGAIATPLVWYRQQKVKNGVEQFLCVSQITNYLKIKGTSQRIAGDTDCTIGDSTTPAGQISIRSACANPPDPSATSVGSLTLLPQSPPSKEPTQRTLEH